MIFKKLAPLVIILSLFQSRRAEPPLHFRSSAYSPLTEYYPSSTSSINPNPYAEDDPGAGSNWNSGYGFDPVKFRGHDHRGFGYTPTPSGNYEYTPSHQIAQFDQSTYDYLPPRNIKTNPAETLYSSAPEFSDFGQINRWKGIRAAHDHQRPKHYYGKVIATDDSGNENPHPEVQPYQGYSSGDNVQGKRFPDYGPGTADSESSSYPPPRTFFKGIFDGVTSTINSLSRPMLSSGWNPAPSAPSYFTQDYPTSAHSFYEKATKPVQHVYIHSHSDSVPTELNLKLILVKPQNASSDLGWNGNQDTEQRIVSSYSSPQFMSDFKRSQINAQLHFVRYKSPLPSTHQPLASVQHPFQSKTISPMFHFLISKRRSDRSENSDMTLPTSVKA